MKQIRSWYSDRIDIGPDEDAWCVTYRTNNPKRLQASLGLRQIDSEMLYRPMNDHPPFESRGQRFPGARMVADETLYLPSSLSLTKVCVTRICDAIEEIESESRVLAK